MGTEIQPPILEKTTELIDLLVAATDNDSSTVVSRLLAEHREVGSGVRQALQLLKIAPFQWSNELGAFYDSTDAFLFESIIWNRSPLKNAMRTWIAKRIDICFDRQVRILCFGDGPGFDSLYFATLGHQVDYLEVSSKSLSFAKRLFAKEGREIKVIEKIDQIGSECYDVVLVLDVLEHLPNPESCIAILAKSLRPQGYLFSHAPFWLLTPSVPTHLKSNLRYSGDIRHLYAPFGLRAFDARAFWNPIQLQRVVGPEKPRRSPGAILRIWIGGYLLFWARIWNAPHSAAVKYLFTSRSIPWSQLEVLETVDGPSIVDGTQSEAISTGT